MVETKRKSRDEAKRKKNKKNQKIGDNRKRRGGVGLPSKMRKELDRLNPSADNSDVDEDIDFAEDLYEYEEGLAQEDSRRNRRFDRVENLEYKLPDEFEDENVSSDYDNEDSNVRDADANSDEDEGFDDGRHERMLQEITGMPSETGKKKKKKNNNVVISEPYPESEYNPSRDVLDGDGQINIEDLLDPLHGKSGYSKLRKRMRQMERKSVPIHAPLPKAEQGRLERKAAYEQSKKDLVKWEPLVKRNREAPTIYFDNKIDLGFSTVGAIASEFEPRTEFEKKIASLVSDDKVMDAHRKDGSRLLELNKVSIEDEKDRQNHIAKMRSLLFRHEMKAKHIKKIKSKTYHRLLKKDRLKAAENMMDPEAAKDLARKHEYERAKERMTLRHKSSSKWTKRIKERGFDVQDEGTRAAVAEQQHMHALLTRKRNSMRDSSSSSGSEDSSDEDDIKENVPGTDQGRASRLLREAKEKTLEVLNEDDEVPNSGVLSLPFMVRGMKKRNEVAAEEAKLALQDLESLSKQFVGSSEAEDPKLVPSSGRMVFGGGVKPAPKSSNKTESDGKIIGDRFYDNSDSEDHLEAEENDDPGNSKSNDLQKDVNVDSIVLHEDSDIHQGSLFKSFDEIVQDPGPKTTCDVAIFASGTWKKMKSGNNGDATNKKSHVSVQPVLQNQDLPETMKELEEDSDSDNEGGQMVDGILSSGPKPSYELPSQGELIRQAFAADDVEDDFEKDKMEILNEENPEPEKPVLLPGWGQWTNVQHKKGLPSWMLKEHENAKKKREEALKKRKDAALRNVIISEKLDKKAEKLYTKTLPFPFTSKEVFEQSIRMPIGPEFNPATAVGALNRPEVVKTPGVIIKPIEYENVDPYEKGDHSKQSARKQKKIKGKRKRAN